MCLTRFIFELTTQLNDSDGDEVSIIDVVAVINSAMNDHRTSITSLR